ncbi:MAG: DUF2332 domain-containing protein [Oricola sp.]
MSAIALPRQAAEAFRRQAEACTSLGSPFTAILCALVANGGVPAGPVHDRLANWPGGLDGAVSDALALRLTGALHYLVLSGRDEQLAATYPPGNADRATIASAVRAAITRHGEAIARFLDSPPQTNETGRSAILLPAFLYLGQQYGLPFVLSELGSSAGLNQNWHRYRYEYGRWGWGSLDSAVTIACEWEGEDPPRSLPVTIAESAGCDIAPVPIETGEDRLRLRSYVWPDQPTRLERLAGALAIAADHPPSVEAAGAADWLAGRLGERRAGQLHAVFHTIMWQYLPRDEKTRLQAMIGDAGRGAAADAPLAWLRFEADGTPGSAGLALTVWDGSSPGGETVALARGDYHGRWIRWNPAA